MDYKTINGNIDEYLGLLNDPAILWPKKKSIDKYVDLMSDLGFKHVFGREANKEIIIAFLNEIIPDRTIVDIEHVRNEQVPLNKEKKKSVYDIYCKTDNGIHIVAEVQNDKQQYYIDRVLYYSSFIIQNQVERGSEDYTICPVYVINIINFTLPELEGRDEVLSLFRLKELKDDIELSRKYTLIFIELPKFTKGLDELERGNILEGFYFCLRYIDKLSERPLVLQQEIMQKLFDAARVAAMDEQEQTEYIRTMITERDRRNIMRYQLDKARSEGIEKGIEKVARKLKENKMPAEEIAANTGLSIDVIENL